MTWLDAGGDECWTCKYLNTVADMSADGWRFRGLADLSAQHIKRDHEPVG